MRTWDFAYRQARKGPWEEYSRDQFRFKNRIKNLSDIISPVLDQKHRNKIFNERFSDDAQRLKRCNGVIQHLQLVGLPWLLFLISNGF